MGERAGKSFYGFDNYGNGICVIKAGSIHMKQKLTRTGAERREREVEERGNKRCGRIEGGRDRRSKRETRGEEERAETEREEEGGQGRERR